LRKFNLSRRREKWHDRLGALANGAGNQDVVSWSIDDPLSSLWSCWSSYGGPCWRSCSMALKRCKG